MELNHFTSHIPDALVDIAENSWTRFVATVDALAVENDNNQNNNLDTKILDICAARPELRAVWAASDFVATTCIGAPLMLYELIDSGDLDNPYAPYSLVDRISESLKDCENEESLHSGLRKIRQREMVRIAWRDLCSMATLEETMRCVSELAQGCIEQALSHHNKWLSQRYGVPYDENRQPVKMVVLGMGKLGGNELNYSSDIDLIFAYESAGETAFEPALIDCRQPHKNKSGIDNQEYFIKLGQKIVTALDRMTKDGFVFRTDMRLRPNGDSGPLALSFSAMEHYYQTHGRDWERYALIKARVVAGDSDVGDRLLLTLNPFIYRKYLDFSAFESIREMKSMIEREIKKKGVKQNIKLGWGGIREIEFLAQCHQLIRGGREKNLQTESLYQAMAVLADIGVIDHLTVQQLLESYRFLRNTEHRLQMVADRQTQQLPEAQLDQHRLAWSMGFENWSAYVEKLDQHRTNIDTQFKMILGADTDTTDATDMRVQLMDVWGGTLTQHEASSILQTAGFEQATSTPVLLREFRSGRLYQAFSGIERDRIDRLMPLALQHAAQHADAERAMVAFVLVIEAIGRRTAYISLLIENPIALKQLLHLCAASAWISSHIGKHPTILDELLSPLQAPSRDIGKCNTEELYAELNHRLAQVSLYDEERRGDTLREYHHAQVLRIAAADVSDRIQVNDVHHALTQLAEVLLQTVFCQAVKFAEHKFSTLDSQYKAHSGQTQDAHKENSQFTAPSVAGVIAYGKLASGELGYNSDLDLVVCYEKPENTDCAIHSEVAHFYNRVGRRFIHLLTTRTQAGIIYQLDMRLRPDGRSGTLVTSLSGLFDYQINSAWTWEHQALVRSRVVAGDDEFKKKFEALRKTILCLERDKQQLKQDVIDMRQKMIDTNSQSTNQHYDIKLDVGGIIDIEFLIQYWILRYANAYENLTIPRTTAECIDALITHSIIDSNTGEQLHACYKTYLRHSLDLKLMERPVLIEQDMLLTERDTIKAIWHQAFA